MGAEGRKGQKNLQINLKLYKGGNNYKTRGKNMISNKEKYVF